MNEASELSGRWYDLVVPVIILVMMIAMGTELRLADFKRMFEMPRATLVGLAGQMIVLPLVGLGFAHWPGFSPEVAIGIIIITACPGGATSNVFSYLARANVALSVTLTSLSSVLCFVTIPLWIGLGLDLFGASIGSRTDAIELPFVRTALQLFIITILPISIGMLIRARRPELCEKLRNPLRRATAGLMAVTIVVVVGSEWENVLRDLKMATAAALVLVVGMLALSHLAARAARLGQRDAFTIAIEVSLQNGALATMIPLSILKMPELIIFPGAYALVAMIPVAAFTALMRYRQPLA